MVRIEAVLLLHLHPGQLASLPRELVAKPGVLLFAYQQSIASGEPILACSDLVVSHFSPSSPSLASCLSVARLSSKADSCARRLRLRSGTPSESIASPRHSHWPQLDWQQS